MPLLYGSITGGRFLAILFFICVTLAGLSSLISILELCVHVLEDFGSQHSHYMLHMISFSCSQEVVRDIDSFRALIQYWASLGP